MNSTFKRFPLFFFFRPVEASCFHFYLFNLKNLRNVELELTPRDPLGWLFATEFWFQDQVHIDFFGFNFFFFQSDLISFWPYLVFPSCSHFSTSWCLSSWAVCLLAMLCCLGVSPKVGLSQLLLLIITVVITLAMFINMLYLINWGPMT